MSGNNDEVRAELAELRARVARTLDADRPEAVARRRKTKQRTARENIDDLVDPGSFVEWGAFAIASQRTRRTQEDLIEKTPADGLVGGIGQHENIWRMAYVRGPEGIVVALAERIG